MATCAAWRPRFSRGELPSMLPQRPLAIVKSALRPRTPRLAKACEGLVPERAAVGAWNRRPRRPKASQLPTTAIDTNSVDCQLTPRRANATR